MSDTQARESFEQWWNNLGRTVGVPLKTMARAGYEAGHKAGLEEARPLLDAADEVERLRTTTYTAKNGKRVGIQGDDGERVDLVHSDQTHALKCAADSFRALITKPGETA